jgi:hypothetical protein
MVLLKVVIPILTLVYFAQAVDDWLLGNVPSTPSLVAGVIGGVPTLTLQNGLVS